MRFRLSKVSTMSQYHHSGDQNFTTWVFRGFQDSNCSTTQDQAASTNCLLTTNVCVDHKCGAVVGHIDLILPKLTTRRVRSKKKFRGRLLGSNKQLELSSASGTVLGKGRSSWVPRHTYSADAQSLGKETDLRQSNFKGM